MQELQILMASPATFGLLAANVILSIMAFQNPRLLSAMLFDIALIRRRREFHRMITSGFIHGDPFHLFVNMLSLFFLGPFLEYAVGTFAFLGIYTASLLAGSLWSWMEHFRDMSYRALGASGAVSGITAAAALFAPLAKIYVFFALPMPLILFAALFIAWSAYASGGRVRDGIGHAAHLGGALTGVALVCIFWPGAVQQGWNQILGALPS